MLLFISAWGLRWRWRWSVGMGEMLVWYVSFSFSFPFPFPFFFWFDLGSVWELGFECLDLGRWLTYFLPCLVVLHGSGSKNSVILLLHPVSTAYIYVQ
jgi:hypothetical protein